MLQQALAIVLLAAFLSSTHLPASSGPITFSDGTFDAADWTSFKIEDTTPGQSGIFTATQVMTGGNPDAHHRVTLTFVDGYLIIGHMRDGAVYDPSTQGGGLLIDFSMDVYRFDPAPNAYMSYNLLLFQNDTYYGASAGNAGESVWRTFSKTGVQSVNFGRLDGPGPANPDFTDQGGPIQLGYATSSGTNWNITQVRDGGLDNWSATIHPGALAIDPSTSGRIKALF